MPVFLKYCNIRIGKMLKIVQKDNPVLRKVATEVNLSSITTSTVQKIISNMKKAVLVEDDGVAIAAPQIGESRRIFVVSRRAFAIENNDKQINTYNDLVCINPKIIKKSKRIVTLPEGCLSVRWIYGQTRRPEKVIIEAYNEKGEKFIRGAGGLLAQIFQHEIEHLDGILFIDHAKDLQEIRPEKAVTSKASAVNRRD